MFDDNDHNDNPIYRRTWLLVAIPPKAFKNQHGRCLSEQLRKNPPDELLPATMIALGGFGRQLPGQRWWID